jgi:NAD(P)-dependent dehydrogenase (short-subunit alcohol dehydrogenase family)
LTWDPRNLPSQAGKTFVVTGGSSGIGYFTGEQLAEAGGRVIIAARSREKAAAALESIRSRVPGADVNAVQLDLASLGSVRAAATELAERGPIDALINNAGLVRAPGARRPRRQVTEDGLELIVGGNALGHFALTAQLFPALAPAGRVIGLGSMSTRMIRLDPSDLLSERRYGPFRAYAFSKHAVHGFAYELDRRLRDAGDSRRSLLAHPGFAVTGLAGKRPGVTDIGRGKRFAEVALFSIVGQGKDHGAWCSVRAATDPDAESGTFFGPARLLLTGPPVPLAPVTSSASPEFGARLWALAEEMTGVRFRIPPRPAH